MSEQTSAGEAFHAGEQALQVRAGVRGRMAEVGPRVIRTHMPDQHRELFEKLPFVVVGGLDAEARPWASLLAGRPGFMRSPDPRTLTIAAGPVAGDPVAGALAVGARVGLLGIELETRRRNRMNGRIVASGRSGFAVAVEQSFGNCPKYITPRQHAFDAASAGTGPVVRREGPRLSAEARAIVAGADTFFIATAAPATLADGPAGGVDVSHRGGPAGFVAISDDGGGTVLSAPDYLGNLFFNTLGNLALNPRAGLVFVDFATGSLLTLTGEAEVVWTDGRPEPPATERHLRFRPAGGALIDGALPLRWHEATAVRPGR
jgi:predicted pyridoxine 5'-phosphate oxidase superfamily flavin-nucleotide-binding protein